MKLSSVGAIIQGFWYDIPRHFPFVILGEYITMPNHIHGIIIINHPKPPVGTLHCNVHLQNCNVQNDGQRNVQNGGNGNVQNGGQRNVQNDRNHNIQNDRNRNIQNDRNHNIQNDIFFPRKIHNNSERNQQVLPIDPMAEFNDYINAQRGDKILSKSKLQTRRLQQSTLQYNSTGNSDDQNEYFQKISPKYGSLGSVIRSYKSVCTRLIRQDLSDVGFKWQDRFHDHIIRNENALSGIANYIRMNPVNWNKDEEIF